MVRKFSWRWLSLGIILCAATATAQTAEEALSRANAHYAEQRFEETVAACDEAIAANPAFSEAYRRRGWAYRFLERWAEADADFTTAISLEPTNPMLFNGRATARYNAGRLADALSDEDRALELDPDYVNALMMRGLIRQGLDDMAGARQDLERALALDPANVMVLTNLGVLCKREGNLDAALAAYNRALSADPKNRAALYNRAWARRQTGDLRGAAADGRILVELFPQEAGAHFELGAALLVLGKEREALREYDRALELDPDHLDSLLDRSMVRRSMGNLDGAIADSTRRLELKPDDSYAHNNRGNAYLDQGNLDAARRDLEAAVALDPGNDKARKNLEILGRKMAAAQPPAPRPTATAAPPKAPPTAAPPPQTAGMIEGATDAVPAAFISLNPARMEPGGGPSADELWTPVAQALPKAAAPSVVSPMPRPLDPGNIDLVDYQAAVVSAVEAMRQIYGPMSPAAEVRFGAKWAPMFDNPFPEAVAYLNRLNPLLSQFLATRAAITEVALDLEAALGEASYAEGFGDPDGLETAMALALIHHDQLQALAARLRLIVEDVLALGEPPDPVADKARRRKRFLDTLAATRDLLPAGRARRRGGAGAVRAGRHLVPGRGRPVHPPLPQQRHRPGDDNPLVERVRSLPGRPETVHQGLQLLLVRSSAAARGRRGVHPLPAGGGRRLHRHQLLLHQPLPFAAQRQRDP